MKTNLSGNAVYFSYITANYPLSNKPRDSSFDIPDRTGLNKREKTSFRTPGF